MTLVDAEGLSESINVSHSEHIKRNFQVASAIAFSWRQITCSHVHLHGWQDKCRHAQRSVPRLAHSNEICFASALMHMNVMGSLLGNGGFIAVVISTRGLVVVAHKQTGIVGQLEQLLNGLEEFSRIATGKIASGSAVIRHEQRIADKTGITD